MKVHSILITVWQLILNQNFRWNSINVNDRGAIPPYTKSIEVSKICKVFNRSKHLIQNFIALIQKWQKQQKQQKVSALNVSASSAATEPPVISSLSNCSLRLIALFSFSLSNCYSLAYRTVPLLSRPSQLFLS